MTDQLFQKLEEKMMIILSEIEALRHEKERLSQENASLKSDQENHIKKLNDLILLLDSITSSEQPAVTNLNMVHKPILLQG